MALGEKLSITLLVALLLTMIGSFFLLRSDGTMKHGSELTFQKGVFVVVNAGTLTGFQLSVNVNDEDYNPLAKNTILTLIVAASLVSLLVGGWAMTRLLALPISDWQLLQATVVIYVLALTIGANVLIEHGVSLYSAVFNAASAFGNAGHWIGRLPAYSSWRTLLTLLPLALVGGLGIPVIWDCFTSFFGQRRVHPHTRAAIFMTAAIYIIGTLLIIFLECTADVDAKSAAVTASVEALNSRSLGMPFGTFAILTRPSQWVVLLLMLIGASPAGTGGGIKGTTLYLLIRDPLRVFKGHAVSPALAAACLWTIGYLLATLIAAMFLIWSYPQIQSDRLFFLAVSAISNSGTSHEPLNIGGDGLYILSAAMFFGRFAPFAMLWIAAKRLTGEVDIASG